MVGCTPRWRAPWAVTHTRQGVAKAFTPIRQTSRTRCHHCAEARALKAIIARRVPESPFLVALERTIVPRVPARKMIAPIAPLAAIVRPDRLSRLLAVPVSWQMKRRFKTPHVPAIVPLVSSAHRGARCRVHPGPMERGQASNGRTNAPAVKTATGAVAGTRTHA